MTFLNLLRVRASSNRSTDDLTIISIDLHYDTTIVGMEHERSPKRLQLQTLESLSFLVQPNLVCIRVGAT